MNINLKLYENKSCNQVENNSNIISYYCGDKEEEIKFPKFTIDTENVIKRHNLVSDEFLRFNLLKEETENNNKLYYFNKKQILIIGRTAIPNKYNEPIEIDNIKLDSTDNIISVVKRVNTHSSTDDLNNIYANDYYWILFTKIIEELDPKYLKKNKQIIFSYKQDLYNFILKKNNIILNYFIIKTKNNNKIWGNIDLIKNNDVDVNTIYKKYLIKNETITISIVYDLANLFYYFMIEKKIIKNDDDMNIILFDILYDNFEFYMFDDNIEKEYIESTLEIIPFKFDYVLVDRNTTLEYFVSSEHLDQPVSSIKHYLNTIEPLLFDKAKIYIEGNYLKSNLLNISEEEEENSFRFKFNKTDSDSEIKFIKFHADDTYKSLYEKTNIRLKFKLQKDTPVMSTFNLIRETPFFEDIFGIILIHETKKIVDQIINYKDKIEFIYFDTIAYDISDILINELDNKFTIINEKQHYPLKNSIRKTDGKTYILEYHN